jgi:hypothetical protein
MNKMPAAGRMSDDSRARMIRPLDRMAMMLTTCLVLALAVLMILVLLVSLDSVAHQLAQISVSL